MKREIFSPVIRRRDGSLHFEKDGAIAQTVAEFASLFFCTSLVLIFIAIALLGTFDVVQAQTKIRSDTGFPAIAPVVLPLDAQPIVADPPLKTNEFHEQLPAFSLWPVSGRLTDGFGERHDPFRRSAFDFHNGQDISASRGTPVLAAEAGVVVFSGSMRGYGHVVIVAHDNNVTTRYGHLSDIDCKAGQHVDCATVLGRVGSTGRSTGPHLHFEVRINNQPVDPIAYLPAHVN